MNLNTCNFIKRIEQVLAELDISAIEDYVIIIIISTYTCGSTLYWYIIKRAKRISPGLR